MPRGRRASHACPLCRRQRRRCDGTCEFGQHFPATMSTEFENAYRLFGLNNMMRIMRSVEPHERQAAAQSILIEATAWRNNPRGLLGYEMDLRSRIQNTLRELEHVNNFLSVVRGQAAARQMQANPNMQLGDANPNMQLGNFLFSSSSSSSIIPPPSSQVEGGYGTQMSRLTEAVIKSSFYLQFSPFFTVYVKKKLIL